MDGVPSVHVTADDLAAFIRASQGTIAADSLYERLLQAEMDRTRRLARENFVEEVPSPEPVATDWLPPQEDTGQPFSCAPYTATQALTDLVTQVIAETNGAPDVWDNVDWEAVERTPTGPTLAQMRAARAVFDASDRRAQLAGTFVALPEVQQWLGRMTDEEEPCAARENSRGAYLCETCFDAMTDRVLSVDQSGTGMAMAQCVACTGETGA